MSVFKVRAHGYSFTVDPDGCEEFGFAAGDRVRVLPERRNATVIGVSPLPGEQCTHCAAAGQPVLWVRPSRRETVCFVPNPATELERLPERGSKKHS